MEKGEKVESKQTRTEDLLSIINPFNWVEAV